jgi:hypothetical protein
MAIIQWVNLEKDAEYANDPDIGSVDRCGLLSIKTAFSNEIPIEYKVKVEPVTTDVVYTEAELKRNVNFKMTKGALDLGNAAEVKMADNIRLPAAGGVKYKLVAKDANDKEVTSIEVESKRKLYYQLMYMDDSNGSVPCTLLTQTENHCIDNYIVLTKKGDTKKVPFHKTISMNVDRSNSAQTGSYNYNHFQSDVSRHYDMPQACKDVGCVAVWSNYIASFKNLVVSETAISSTANPNCVVSATEISIKFPGKLLWHALDDQDDAAKRWFVSCEIIHTPNPPAVDPSKVNPPQLVAPVLPTTITLTKDNIDIAGNKQYTYGGYSAVKITPPTALADLLKTFNGTIKVTLEVLIIRGFTGGFSYPSGYALTTCCTKSWWNDISSSNADVIWNHELGHRIGMVAYGNTATDAKKKLGPDAPPNIYGESAANKKDPGHSGSHCAKGVTYTPATNSWSGTPGCIMFGATSNGGVPSPLNYCDDCAKIVRKLDLSKTALASS